MICINYHIDDPEEPMNGEQKAAYVNAMAIAAQIEMQSMIARNNQRASEGHAQAYGEDEFYELIEKYGISHEAIATLYQD
ncbi:MAG: hypothetical protein AAGJ40_09260 [Planctomycetota bacterium]